jgi:hypothetical protein
MRFSFLLSKFLLLPDNIYDIVVEIHILGFQPYPTASRKEEEEMGDKSPKGKEKKKDKKKKDKKG